MLGPLLIGQPFLCYVMGYLVIVDYGSQEEH